MDVLATQTGDSSCRGGVQQPAATVPVLRVINNADAYRVRRYRDARIGGCHVDCAVSRKVAATNQPLPAMIWRDVGTADVRSPASLTFSGPVKNPLTVVVASACSAAATVAMLRVRYYADTDTVGLYINRRVDSRYVNRAVSARSPRLPGRHQQL